MTTSSSNADKPNLNQYYDAANGTILLLSVFVPLSFLPPMANTHPPLLMFLLLFLFHSRQHGGVDCAVCKFSLQR